MEKKSTELSIRHLHSVERPLFQIILQEMFARSTIKLNCADCDANKINIDEDLCLVFLFN